MAKNPLEPSNEGNAMPGVTPAVDQLGINMDEWQYRIGYFTIGGEDDDTLQMESLLTRSLQGSVIVVERKDSISSATGIYTAVVIYMEKRNA
jgi:hypothetical protein